MKMKKVKKPNAEFVWKQFEDDLAPRLRWSAIDRAVYSYLLRHTRLEGQLRLRFALSWLATGVRLSVGATRQALRRLVDQRALRLIERSKAGHVVEVRLPAEICAAHPPRALPPVSPALPSPGNLETTDFLRNPALRQAIHARERGTCFYCLRRLAASVKCLDHVVPQAEGGGPSYRNLVSCCLECNSHKSSMPAADFLRWLYRERRLTFLELSSRLRALDALVAGKLRPALATPGSPLARRGRPRLHPSSLQL